MPPSPTGLLRARTSVDLARCPSACPRARHWATGALTRWDATSEETDDVVLVVCELVTNAVIHACGPIRAHLSRDERGRYHVQVDDGGPSAPPGARSDDHGRGLLIVEHLAAHHGRHHAPDPCRSRAWAVLNPTARIPTGPRTAVPATRSLEHTS